MNTITRFVALLSLSALAGGCNRAASADSKPAQATPPAAQNKQPPPQQQHPQATAAPADSATQMKNAQMALSQINQAQDAIRAGDNAQAQRLLDDSATRLRAMYEGVPGRSVVSRMNSSHDDYAPLMSEIGTEQVYLDPDVVANVKRAQQQQQNGKADQARDDLRLARDKMVADVALLPVEEAYSRVVAARSELQAGRRDNALELLRNVPVIVSQVQVSAPLVPVRFDLRAAAAAAQDNDWPKAQQLLTQAQQQLQAVQASGGQQADQLKPLADRAAQLRTRADSKQKPKPREISALADDLRKHTRPM